MRSIKQILMSRDGMSEHEANNQIDSAKEELQFYLDNNDMENAENICSEYFGLEPDYIFELL